MKLIASILLVASLAFAGDAPPVVFHGPAQLAEMSLRVEVNQGGAVSAIWVTARYHQLNSDPSGKVDTNIIGSVEIDLTKTDGYIIDQLVGAADREWAKAMPGWPLRERRNDRRSRP